MQFYPNRPIIIHLQETVAQLDDALRSDAGAATDMSQTASGHGSAENTSTAVIKHCFSVRPQVDTVAFLTSGRF